MNSSSSASAHSESRPFVTDSVTIPRSWHRRLLERLVAEPLRMFLVRVGQAQVRKGERVWLARGILADRSALASARRGEQFFVVTGHDGDQGPMPYVESNLPLHPASVVGELFYGVGAWRDRAWGFVRAEGGERFRALGRLDLPGAGMESLPLLAESSPSPALNVREKEKLSRTLGAWGPGAEAALLRLRQGGILLVGASRNGGFVAEWAARLGVPLVLLDPKPLKASHLGEVSWLFNEADVGELKAPLLAERLSTATANAPLPDLRGLAATVDSPQGLQAARQAAVLVDCADTDAARLATALLASAFHKVQLSIATGVSFDAEGRRTLGADVRLIVPGEGACLGCLGGLVDYQGALYDLTSTKPPAASEETEWRNSGRSGSLRSLNQMASGLGLRLLEDLYAGRVTQSRWTRLEFDEAGRAILREPASSSHHSTCAICARAGVGDEGFGA